MFDWKEVAVIGLIVVALTALEVFTEDSQDITCPNCDAELVVDEAGGCQGGVRVRMTVGATE